MKVYGDLPIWVAIEVWDFGSMSKIFAGMKYEDQHCIAAKYGASNGKEFSDWLRSFNFIRNVSAHHSRLWNINILERSPAPVHLAHYNLNNAKPFMYFCLMNEMLLQICPNSSWWGRFVELVNNFPTDQSKSIQLEDFGVTKNWSFI